LKAKGKESHPMAAKKLLNQAPLSMTRSSSLPNLPSPSSQRKPAVLYRSESSSPSGRSSTPSWLDDVSSPTVLEDHNSEALLALLAPLNGCCALPSSGASQQQPIPNHTEGERLKQGTFHQIVSWILLHLGNHRLALFVFCTPSRLICSVDEKVTRIWSTTKT